MSERPKLTVVGGKSREVPKEPEVDESVRRVFDRLSLIREDPSLDGVDKIVVILHRSGTALDGLTIMRSEVPTLELVGVMESAKLLVHESLNRRDE